jgi:hypothetical protein
MFEPPGIYPFQVHLMTMVDALAVLQVVPFAPK